VPPARRDADRVRQALNGFDALKSAAPTLDRPTCQHHTGAGPAGVDVHHRRQRKSRRSDEDECVLGVRLIGVVATPTRDLASRGERTGVIRAGSDGEHPLQVRNLLRRGDETVGVETQHSPVVVPPAVDLTADHDGAGVGLSCREAHDTCETRDFLRISYVLAGGTETKLSVQIASPAEDLAVASEDTRVDVADCDAHGRRKPGIATAPMSGTIPSTPVTGWTMSSMPPQQRTVPSPLMAQLMAGFSPIDEAMRGPTGRRPCSMGLRTSAEAGHAGARRSIMPSATTRGLRVRPIDDEAVRVMAVPFRSSLGGLLYLELRSSPRRPDISSEACEGGRVNGPGRAGPA
jgi:hypothetical protein